MRHAVSWAFIVSLVSVSSSYARRCSEQLGPDQIRVTIEFDHNSVIMLGDGRLDRAILATIIDTHPPTRVVVAFPERANRISTRGRFVAQYEDIRLERAHDIEYLGQGTIRVPVYRIVGRVPPRKNIMRGIVREE